MSKLYVSVHLQLQNIKGKFEFHGHRITVKVTAAEATNMQMVWLRLNGILILRS